MIELYYFFRDYYQDSKTIYHIIYKKFKIQYIYIFYKTLSETYNDSWTLLKYLKIFIIF